MSHFLMKLLANDDIENADAVASVVRALAKEKLGNYLLQSVEAELADLCIKFRNKQYKQLCEKFKR